MKNLPQTLTLADVDDKDKLLIVTFKVTTVLEILEEMCNG